FSLLESFCTTARTSCPSVDRPPRPIIIPNGDGKSCTGLEFFCARGFDVVVVDRLMTLLRAEPPELFLQLSDLFIRAFLQIDQLVSRPFDSADEFVQLEVNCPRVTVLCILD